MNKSTPNIDLLVKHGNVSEDDVLNLMFKVAHQEKGCKVVQSFLQTFPIETFDNKYDWLNKMFDLIQSVSKYGNDTQGIEEIKTPERFIFKDKFGDCDDYSTLWMSILMNTKIPFNVKLVKYEKNGYWAHVYVVVPTSNNSDYVTLDNVNPQGFDKEVDYVESKLYKQ